MNSVSQMRRQIDLSKDSSSTCPFVPPEHSPWQSGRGGCLMLRGSGG